MKSDDRTSTFELAAMSHPQCSVEGYEAQVAVASCAPKANLSYSAQDSQDWQITFLQSGDNEKCKLYRANQSTVNLESFPTNEKDTKSGKNCAWYCSERKSEISRIADECYYIENSKDVSADEEDWIITWSVEEVSFFFRGLRLSGEGSAEADERAALVEKHLINGAILARAMNDDDGKSWLANTLALPPYKVAELQEHLSEARILRERPYSESGCRSNPLNHPLSLRDPCLAAFQTTDPCTSQEYTCRTSNKEASSSVLQVGNLSGCSPPASIGIFNGVEIAAAMGADLSRRKVKEWSSCDVVSFLRDLIPYSSLKDSEFRNENIHRQFFFFLLSSSNNLFLALGDHLDVCSGTTFLGKRCLIRFLRTTNLFKTSFFFCLGRLLVQEVYLNRTLLLHLEGPLPQPKQ